jgi:hypothetical protein
MSHVIDVRDTEQAELSLLNLYTNCCKVSHLLAMKRYLAKGVGLPEGVDVIRPAYDEF